MVAIATRDRPKIVFMSDGVTKSLGSAPRPRFGAGRGHDGWVLEEGVGRSVLQRLLFRRAARADEVGGDKDQQISFLRTFTLRAEEPADEGDVPEERYLVVHLLHFLTGQSTHHERRAIPDRHLGRDVAHGENRLI